MTAAPGTADVPPLARALCRALRADSVAFWVASGTASVRLAWASAFSPPSGVDGEAWKRTLQTAVARCAKAREPIRITPKQGDTEAEFVFVPVVADGALLGVGGFRGGREMAGAFTSHREILLESLPLLARSIRAPARSSDADLSPLALGLVSARGKAEAARAAADALQGALGMKRVVLFERALGKWRILACSGAQAIDPRGAAAKEILAGFQAALAGTSSARSLGSTVARWHDDSSARHVGILAEGGWGTDQDAAMRSAAPLVAHALHARRSLLQRLWPEPADSSPSAMEKARAVKAATVAAAAFATVVLFWPFPQTFKGTCELVPSERGSAVAEMGGRIEAILVAEGDTVSEGQPIARIDSSKIQAQLEAARYSEAKAAAEAREQQQQDEVGAFRQAQLGQRRAAEEVRKLSFDLGQCTVPAPMAGVVVTKDLALKRGQIAQPGMVICEVASLTGWDLRIKLDEIDAGPLERALGRVGSLRVRCVLQARSDVTLEGKLDSPRQISQMAYPEAQGTFIFVTLRGIGLPEALRDDLRPGFSGIAKIEGPRRPLVLGALSRLWQRVRLHLFF